MKYVLNYSYNIHDVKLFWSQAVPWVFYTPDLILDVQLKGSNLSLSCVLLMTKLIPIIFQHDPLVNIKKVDCSLLPPTQRSLEMNLLRTRYVTMLWSHADSPCPRNGLSPTDYG